MTSRTIHTHADGGSYALLTNAPIKDDATGDWLDGVLYISAQDDQIRATTAARWAGRFVESEYEGEEIAVIEMLRRANPTVPDWDFIRVFESWGEREGNLTAVLLDLAIAATMIKLGAAAVEGEGELTISTADLRDISESHEITRVENPSGWTIKIRRFDAEMISDKG